MTPSFTRQTLNTTATEAYKKRMANIHGDVTIVNKTGLAKLNRQLKKKGTLEADDYKKVGYKKIDISKHKPPVKKKW